MKLAGFIYLHEITQKRMFGVTRKNIEIFKKICGNDALKNLVIGTTKWDQVELEKGQQREQELKDKHWKEMVQQGSVIMRVHADSSSAWKIVNRILQNDAVGFVRFQDAFQKTISDVEAGKLEELVELRKQPLAEERTANMGDGQLRQNELEEIRKRMRKTTDEIQKLKVKRKKRRNILQSKQAKI